MQASIGTPPKRGSSSSGTYTTGDPRRNHHALTTRIPLVAGSVVHLRTGSGGGYGPPSERDPALVYADIREGYTTMDHARMHYPHAFETG
ncbi:Uncharacterised protein [Mycobacteroides abscessus subsp. massiliense]|nr:Uncharacterised protein [Mycobacteroides abscessus subsp. massiliense]SKI13332.1 Uncharacterised protein [Mycobacteroides abscessus subsp. massiliense]SKK29923.1 Uncharacterised protein [Mycobacteroides abscessus subsp. massiliense]SKK36473.1 Uncharacterised protein [Mycobacteroides abscessus subsp. massiliense]SKK47262.1 Uncharacterised protein [Mycobacteroides abscessus subsp. massiliense]